MRALKGMNTWSTVLRSPWRLSLWVSSLPIVVAAGMYSVELGSSLMADSGYQEHAQDVCKYLDEKDVDSIVVEPYLFETSGGPDVIKPMPLNLSIQHTGCLDPDKGSSVYKGYMGEIRVRNWLHGKTSEGSDGFRTGVAQIGLLGKVVGGKLRARIFCVSSGNTYDTDYSGLGYAADGKALAWGYGVGPGYDVEYLLSGLSESRTPLPDELEVTRQDLEWVESLERWGVFEAFMPQGVCSPTKLDYSGARPGDDSFEGGPSGCHGDPSCGHRHLAHELKRLKAWASAEKARMSL